jgi:hypothetical protein
VTGCEPVTFVSFFRKPVCSDRVSYKNFIHLRSRRFYMSPSIPYFIGHTSRLVPQVVGNVRRMVEVPVDTVQGKVVSVGRIKTNPRGSEYCLARVASGSQGFAMIKGYNHLAYEVEALAVGDKVVCDGSYRPETKFDPQVGAEVTTNWFTVRSMNILAPAPSPVAQPETLRAHEYESAPL